MKTVLIISLVANMTLVIALALVLERPRGERFPDLAVAQGVPNPEPESRKTPLTAEGGRQGNFRWREVESTDYRTYIANLRSIECPERTIRDIITADVHSLYESKHAELERRLQPTDEVTLARRPTALRKLEEAHSKLRDEESALLLALLGQSDRTPTLDSAPARAPEAIVDQPVRIPVVLQEADLASLNLNSAQLQAITNLRQRFVAGIGGPNQDPNDAGYRARWQESQPEIDELLKGMLGPEDYHNYQISARMKADANGIKGR